MICNRGHDSLLHKDNSVSNKSEINEGHTGTTRSSLLMTVRSEVVFQRSNAPVTAPDAEWRKEDSFHLLPFSHWLPSSPDLNSLTTGCGPMSRITPISPPTKSNQPNCFYPPHIHLYPASINRKECFRFFTRIKAGLEEEGGFIFKKCLHYTY
ncbi:unnamed protein product [Lepeophtheirus salmonis]|uniref:(salmon louse) hypothetical protein n=1 Tax=Lepeophtheirus salmonis TaxID=72036 RepID=A0A7R8CRF4_LEPSM|nr:unnamed protein product [Lepeophtheirus salmonis]CAF2870131.1 unnamed protein product [Lepeophtheirus salmonis]